MKRFTLALALTLVACSPPQAQPFDVQPGDCPGINFTTSSARGPWGRVSNLGIALDVRTEPGFVVIVCVTNGEHAVFYRVEDSERLPYDKGWQYSVAIEGDDQP